MQQRRWVSYIYRYREYVRCEIAGFIKVQRISNKDTDVTRIRMGMKMYKEYACTCYAYLLWNGQAKPFTTMQFAAGERDTILTSVELPWNNPLGDGVAFPDYDGVYFVCDDGEILAGIWTPEQYDLRQVQVVDKSESPVGADTPIMVGADQRSAAENEWGKTIEPGGQMTQETDPSWMAEYAGAGMKPQTEAVGEIPQIPLPTDTANGYQEMLTTYPKLPLFAGSQIVDGVKIAPQDIGRLDMANWKLGVNSFLAHGYYKYQYLMLGTVRMNKAELHVIGVPGIFTNKERYLANMFGFRVFIPVRKTKILTGNFGYWVSEVAERGAEDTRSRYM